MSAAKPRRSASRNDDGSRRGGVTPAFRTAEINGNVYLLTRAGRKIDLRTNASRHFVSLIEGLIADLGGLANVSVAEMELVRRAAALGVDLAYQESQALHDNDNLDPHIYRTMAQAQRNILQALGLRRRTRDITPRLYDILEGHAREVADA